MTQPIPVYIEPGDQAAIEAELDRQMGIEPKPRREKPWQCLVGEAPATCQHNRLTKVHEEGRVVITCECSHRWLEVH